MFLSHTHTKTIYHRPLAIYLLLCVLKDSKMFKTFLKQNITTVFFLRANSRDSKKYLMALWPLNNSCFN